MTNLTLSIDELTLVRARKAAAARGASVNALVRDHLTILGQDDLRLAKARRKLAALAQASTATIGPRDWTRAELYDRRYLRLPGL